MTAVPAATFRSGLPVAPGHTGHQEQMAKAPIAPHPLTMPGASGGGRRKRRTGFGQGTAAELRRGTHAAVGARRQGAPAGGRPAELAHATGGPPVQNNQSPAGRRDVAVPVSRRADYRHAPPAQQPPFPVRQKAMQPDAGRPLEPQQMNTCAAASLRGHRATRDSAHPAAPITRATPAPAAAPMPRQRPDMTPAPQPQQHHSDRIRLRCRRSGRTRLRDRHSDRTRLRPRQRERSRCRADNPTSP